MYQLLLAGPYTFSNRLLGEIKALGYEARVVADEKKLVGFDPSEIDALVCGGRIFSNNSLSEFKRLKFIQLLSAGYDALPYDEIKKNGILLANARGVYSVPIAEWVLWNILQIYKQAHFFERAMQESCWQKSHDILELSGKTALIAGTGSIGTEVAKRLKAFGVTVLGVNTSGVSASEFYDETHPVSSMAKLLRRCDIVVCTLPLNDGTLHLFDKKMFFAMKDGAVFINVSRGAVVCERDLIQCLKSGSLRGAALDVFETEPLPASSELWELRNIYIYPHNSFASEKNSLRLNALVMENLSAFASGGQMQNLI